MGVDFAARPNLQVHGLATDRSWGLKFQRDWLEVTWMRSGEAEYPRWKAVRERAQEALSAFIDEFGGSVVQVEVEYSNRVDAAAAKGIVAVEFAGQALGEMETLHVHSHHLIEFDGCKARLHLDVSPVAGSDELELSLTVRGRPGEGTVSEAVSFADGAREHIVVGFADITSEEFHDEWERQ